MKIIKLKKLDENEYFLPQNEQDVTWVAECLPCQKSKCKDKYFDSKPRALFKRELPHFSNACRNLENSPKKPGELTG